MQHFIIAAWYRNASWLVALWPLEWLYRAVIAARKAAYQLGILTTQRMPKPVVVVGNLTVGGTGKTPVVIALAQALQARGINVGIVSRGYPVRLGKAAHRVMNTSTPDACGDEAILLQRRTGCPVVVSGSRVNAARTLLQQFEVDILLSDDGLQHYALARDLEVALLDAQRGLGNGHCLPAGPLREPATRLQAIEFVLRRNGGDARSAFSYVHSDLRHLHSSKTCDLLPAALQQHVYGVAGIGQPEQFFALLEEAGFIVDARTFPDHHRYRAQDFDELRDKPIIMTEKDAVKCGLCAPATSWYLPVSATVPDELVAVAERLAHTQP